MPIARTTAALVAACVLATLATVLLTVREKRGAAGVAKCVASACFVAIGMVRWRDGLVGDAIFVGLVLGALGDVLLIFRNRHGFMAGLGSFLFGHVAYAVAFARRSTAIVPGAVAAVLFAGVSVPVWRWAAPGIRRSKMVAPVAIYVLAIGAMVALAVSAAFTTERPVYAIGAGLFAASDCAVMRERFVTPSPNNRAWGLPLYYAAQLMFALS